MLGVCLRKLCPQGSFEHAFREKKLYENRSPEGGRPARGSRKLLSGGLRTALVCQSGSTWPPRPLESRVGAAPGALLGRSWRSWSRHGCLLGRSWGLPGRAWAPFGPLWAAPGGPLGGPQGVVVPEQRSCAKHCKNHMFYVEMLAMSAAICTLDHFLRFREFQRFCSFGDCLELAI